MTEMVSDLLQSKASVQKLARARVTQATTVLHADWQMVVGLEVHVQLKTRTKAFCGCATEFGAAPNVKSNYMLPPRETTAAFDGFHLATKPKVLE